MKMIFVICACLIFQNEIMLLHGAGWSYEGSHGPGYWVADYPACGGSKQSPINFPSLCDMKYDENLKPFVLNGFTSDTEVHTVKNNGHTLQVDVAGYMTVSGGGLSGTHRVAQFHFHWGKDNSKGSEHFLNGIQYPLELHIVTYNLKYPDISAAVDKSDGLAVLGFLFEVGEINNINYAALLEKISQVRYSGNTTSISGLKMRHLLPNQYDKFYRYQGSLTTPPCYESVTWTVFEETVKLSSEQFALFRTLFEDKTGLHAMTTNYRPLQRLLTRKVYQNFQKAKDNTGIDFASNIRCQKGLLIFMLIIFISLKI